ncbi:HAMP domain-containing sensor histidine kinase [Clostridium manihotivorum]|uniref:Heme sensor protein HssS n=1 Tax=Clostridium manihotivorum TaxID=2320868 RepID=A0A410E0D5_9CLOT|nr:HAMP domain-containing sensor histidine kinase [Clostridium manihotivorum]QAA34775.1 two-component sensor histidine kinase [Clostridium manihotivorum]
MKKIANSIRAKVTLTFISILCFSCAVSLGFALVLDKIFKYLNIYFYVGEKDITQIVLLIITLIICALIGSITVFYVTKHIIKPIKQLSDSTKEIAKGNFDIKIKAKCEDEIGVLANNFNSMIEELKSMEYLRKDFMSSVSHEFKTPIASIQGFVEILKDKNLPRERFEEYTDIIIEETKRLNNLCSNILRLSRLDNQVIQNEIKRFSLDEQIRKTILLLEDQWTQKDLELNIELEELTYDGDEELIQQIWLNLISNAIKFSNSKGKINISLKTFDKKVIVEIEDYGIGISEEGKSRIYEKFYQEDTSRAEEGNGLGLAIVKRIVEICQGTITFESNIGEGTKFIITLPIIEN